MKVGFFLFLMCVNTGTLLGQSRKATELFDSLNYLDPKLLPNSEDLIDYFELIRELAIEGEEKDMYYRSALILSDFYYRDNRILKYSEIVKSLYSDIINGVDIRRQQRTQILNNYALLCSYQGNYELANSMYYQAIENADGLLWEICGLKYNIAVNYSTIGDYQQAKNHFNNALGCINDFKANNLVDYESKNLLQLKCFVALSKVLIKERNFHEASETLKAINYKSKFEFDQSREKSIINLFHRKSEVDIALSNFNEARSNLDSVSVYIDNNPYRKFQTYRLNGLYHQRIGNYEAALKNFETSLSLAKEDYKTDKEFAFIPLIYDNLGDLYLERSELKTAVVHYHSGLGYFDDELSVDLNANPNYKKFTEFPEALSLIQKKAKVAFEIYQSEADDYYLDVSVTAYISAVELLAKMKKSYLVDGSKFFVAEKALPLYLEALEVLDIAYRTKPNKVLLENVFKVIEGNKSSILFESVKNKFELLSSELPKEIIEKENDLSSSVSYYSRLLSEERQKLDSDSLRILEYENAVFEAQESLNILKNRIKGEYQEYYLYRESLDVPKTINDVQFKLNKGDLMLEYFQFENTFYGFTISKDKVNFEILDKEGILKSNLENYKKLISAPPNDQDQNELEKLSKTLTDQLISKVLNGRKGIKNLIIIPDGILNQIPFESLVSEEDGSLQYLISKYSFQYYLSAEQFLDSENRSESSSEILAFAPNFSQAISESRTCDLDALGNLPYAKMELNFLKSNFQGEFVANDSISIEDFKSNYKNFPIVHLATHACLNEIDPMLNEIHFNDGYLTSYDIRELRARPELVVLSACNTASGSMQGGEGMMSLSRGFFASGVRSLQSSLWSLDDLSSYEIIYRMYSNLKKGSTKSKALRSAKLEYLSTADKLHRHPYYWASMIHFGDDYPLFEAKTDWEKYLLVGGGLLILLMAFLFIKSKTK